MHLEGKIALVTGAATGIGAAIAEGLAAHGAIVIGADILWDGSALTPEIARIHCDVSNPDSVQACVDKVEGQHGRIDILINDAALCSGLTPKPFDKIDPKEWIEVMTVNTLAAFLMSRAVAPGMRKRKWGRIINLTSATIFSSQPGLVHYVASKGAVASLTRSIAHELGSDGITVNAIAPGLVMTKNMQENDAYTQEVQDQAISAQLIQQPLQTDDLVGVCLFLVGDGASMMSGQILAVDGGMAVH